MHQNTTRILESFLGAQWAIQEEWFTRLYSILTDREGAKEYLSLMADKGEPLEHTYTALMRGSHAIIPIEGPIFPKANMMTRLSGATSLEMVMQDYRAAQENPAVSDIILVGNTPGGAVTGIDEFVAELNKEGRKPVYGHGSGNVASAGYWIFSQTDRFTISPTTSVGSIGVLMSIRKSRPKGDDEYPKEIQFVSSVSPNKRLDPESKEGAAEAMAAVNKIAEVFVANVASGRNVSIETVLQSFGKGGMITGSGAVDAGMVDGIDTLEALIARLDGEQEFSSNGDDTMKKEEYLAKHPTEYNAILALGVAEAEGKFKPQIQEAQSEATSLKATVDELNAKLEKAEAINAENAQTIKSFEKEKAIRAEKDIAISAEQIFSEAAKGIKASLHPKIRKCVSHEAFVTDGELDAEGFKAAVVAEVKDWKKQLGASADEPVIQGFGTPPEDNTDDETAAEEYADSMASRFFKTDAE